MISTVTLSDRAVLRGALAGYRPLYTTKSLYSSQRRWAWRNLMVATINAALERGLFALDDPNQEVAEAEFEFTLDGRPVEARVRDASYGEVHVLSVLEPDRSRSFLLGLGILSWAGAASAHGWLERRKGLWLQTGEGCAGAPEFRVTERGKGFLASVKIEPNGFADRGKFML